VTVHRYRYRCRSRVVFVDVLDLVLVVIGEIVVIERRHKRIMIAGLADDGSELPLLGDMEGDLFIGLRGLFFGDIIGTHPIGRGITTHVDGGWCIGVYRTRFIPFRRGRESEL